jgi:hypothetical protein
MNCFLAVQFVCDGGDERELIAVRFRADFVDKAGLLRGWEAGDVMSKLSVECPVCILFQRHLHTMYAEP